MKDTAQARDPAERRNDGGEGRKEEASSIAGLTEPAITIAALDQKKLWRVIGVLAVLVGLGAIPTSIAEGSTTGSPALQFLGAGSGVVLCAAGALIVALTGRRARVKVTVRPLSGTASAPRIRQYADRVMAGYGSAGTEGRLWAVTAHPGYGKSTLLELIAHDFSRRKALVIHISAIEETSTFRACEQLAEAIAEELEGTAARINSIGAAILDASNRDEDNNDPADTLRRLGKAIHDELSAINGELVFLVDELEAITDPAARTWLLDLANRIAHKERRLVVLASEPAAGLAAELPGPGTQLPLREHTREEIEQEVRLRLSQPPEDCVRLVMEYSSGVPFCVDTALRLLAEGRGVEALRGDSTPGDRARPIVWAVRKTLTRLDEQAAAQCGEGFEGLRLSDWLAVLDQFGGGVLGDTLKRLLVEHEGLAEADTDRLLDWLIRQSHVVRPLHTHEDSPHQLLTFLRETHLSGLLVNDRPRYEFLHAKAEREYWRMISATEAEDIPKARLSEMQVRYENAEWHQITIEWLDHAYAASPNRGASAEVARSCAALFFKRYFWYDVMAQTRYCRELLAYYELRWGQERWVQALLTFEANYVRGPYRPGWLAENRDQAAWQKADAAINTLVKELRLPQAGSRVTDETREAFIYLNLIRVDSLRFTHHAQAALDLWQEIVAAGPEGWILPWIDAFAAETMLELGLVQEAADRLEDIEDRALRFQDYDLRIVSGVVRADLAWDDGDLETALAILTRAVLAAAAYHLQQEVDIEEEDFGLPNTYSRLRHQHTVNRLRERLAELERYRGGKGARRMWDARITAFFQPFWDSWAQRRPGSRSHPGGPLPPAPSPADLLNGGSNSNYRDDIAAGILDRMREQLGQPLETPLPSVDAET